MRNLKLLSSVVLIAATALGIASTASAATTLGSTPASSASVLACAGATLFVQDQSSGDSPQYAAPTDGVITSWSVMGGGVTAQLIMKAVRETSPDNYTVIGSTPSQTVLSGALNTFSTRIPVKAGDKPALWMGPMVTAPCHTASPNASDVVSFWGGSHPEPAVGDVYPVSADISGRLLDLSAQLEPDVDGDGFGDETQDLCTELASTQAPCPAPETTITKVPTKLKVKGKKKATATFEFSADVAGSSFACSLDGGAAAPCTSPYAAKVKKGTHTFEVTATSAVGRVDATPDASTFKVKKKKRKK